MSIDEYLNQLNTLKRQEERLLRKYELAESEAEGMATPNNFGMPHSHTNRNYTEERLIKLVSAGENWKQAREDYKRFYKAFEKAMYNLLYWEGLIIDLVYITNPAVHRDKLDGLSDILNTKDRSEILAKLDIAKEHLRQILNENGYKIE